MIKIIGVGDIMPGGILSEIKDGWVDPDVVRLLHAADIRVGTLECAIGNEPTFYDEKMNRLADVIYAPDCDLDKLTVLGIDIVSLANNHFFDLGSEGAAHTIKLLDDMGIAHIGAGKDLDEAKAPVVKMIDGKSVAFVAFCDWRNETVGWCPFAAEGQPGVNPMDDVYVINEIKMLKSQNDYVVVMPHWGMENTWTTTNHVYAMAKKMMKAGADIILGSHPHRIQPVVQYGGKIVAYSLGNFLFPDRLICTPRSTYYGPEKMDLEKLPRTDGYPYVEQVTYKAWKPLANIGMITEIIVDKNIQYVYYQTLMGKGKVCLYNSKETARLLSRRGFLLRYTPYQFYYLLFYSIPHIAKGMVLSVLHRMKKMVLH